MKRFERFETQDIPNQSKPIVDAVSADIGFVPNMIEGIVRSPQMLKGYASLSTSFERTSLSPEEQQIVLLAASRFNECAYCTSVHSTTAEGTDLPWDTIEKIRHREVLPDERHEALRTFTEALIRTRGSIPQDVWTAFESAGFDERNALDVVLGVSLKMLTNTVNHLMETPLDEQFEKRRWTIAEVQTANA